MVSPILQRMPNRRVSQRVTSLESLDYRGESRRKRFFLVHLDNLTARVRHKFRNVHQPAFRLFNVALYSRRIFARRGKGTPAAVKARPLQ